MCNCNCNSSNKTALKAGAVKDVTYVSVEAAAAAAANQAMLAYCQNTFSVGGVMLDGTGKVLNAIHNNVVMNNKTNDPTAHGERQLIDWYYAQIAQGVELPPPSEITIVTSLDPCCMCTGSIITGGFNVISAAFDTYSGINYDTLADFPSLSDDLAVVAQETFSYPAVNGDNCFSRPASSAPVAEFFTQDVIDVQTLALCESIFDATLTQVKASINSDLPPDQLKDIKALPTDDPIVVALQAIYPDALQYTAPSRGAPDAGLAPFLIEAANTDIALGGKGNSVAFLDYFGNLLLCLSGNEKASLIQTAFLLVTRNYAQLRYNLRDSLGDEKVLPYLGHPKYGTFVFSHGPDESSHSLIELGAYGSTMEGALPEENPNSFQYGVPTIAQTELDAYCQKLPPLYSSEIKVHPQQVVDQGLIDALEAGLPTV